MKLEDWMMVVGAFLLGWGIAILMCDAKADEDVYGWRTYKGTGAEEIRNRRLDYWSDRYIESTQPRGKRNLAIDRWPEGWERKYERESK